MKKYFLFVLLVIPAAFGLFTTTVSAVEDLTPPEVASAPVLGTNTVTYTFTEAVELRDASGNIIAGPDFGAYLKIYNASDYSKHNVGEQEPTHYGIISSAVLSSDGLSLTINYSDLPASAVDVSYVVDAWGMNITDAAGNKMLANQFQVFTIPGDNTPPAVTGITTPDAHTIVYNLSEPIELRAADGSVVPTSEYVNRLHIYDFDAYSTRHTYDAEPTALGNVTAVTVSSDEKVITFTYADSLIKKTDTRYIIDAWGLSITDKVGNVMPFDEVKLSQVFTISGDTTAPVVSSIDAATPGVITYNLSEPVVIRDAGGNVAPAADYVNRLRIYKLSEYAAHEYGAPDIPPTYGGIITAVEVSNGGAVFTVHYDGSLVTTADTQYVVDAWGSHITDVVGNEMVADPGTQSFPILGDNIGPKVTKLDDTTPGTLVYTFDEPVQLRDTNGVLVTPSDGDYKSYIAIYNFQEYVTHAIGIEPTHYGVIDAATLSGDARTLTIHYSGSLVNKDNTDYIIDAWGMNITDALGNKMPFDQSMQAFTILGDTTPPVITIGDYLTSPTNQDITVTATVNEGSLASMTHVFTGNDSFEFVATDMFGNVSTKTVAITNIDKVLPVITIGTYTTDPTNNDIEVSATTDKGTLNAASHVFTENGSFDFIATDVAGNVTTKTVTIANIDKTAPVITIGKYVQTPTNQDVTVTATVDDGELDVPSCTLSSNGDCVFHAVDALGNTSSKTVTITNIDKVLPVISIGAYTTDPTNNDIEVSATADKGTLNAASHVFTENGSFDFIATDVAGNVTTKTVTIANIDKTAPVITLAGVNPASIGFRENYVDAGASAVDAVNGVVGVTRTGTVNTLVLGTYSIAYSAVDAVGNLATSTRTVNVVVIPVVQGSRVSGSGGGGSSVAPVRPVVVPPQNNTGGEVLGASTFNFSMNLGVGARSDDVTELQNRLTAEGHYNGPITGFFGPLTMAGVRSLQRAHGLPQTGYVGPLTLSVLNTTVAPSDNAALIATIMAKIAELRRQIDLLNAGKQVQ